MNLRMRRLRENSLIRDMVRENSLNTDDFIYPLFIVEGEDIKREIKGFPDVYHFSVDRLNAEIDELIELGIKSVILFGVPDVKDEVGSGAFADDGIVQKAIRQIKSHTDEILVITDVCLCEYTSHGHCGLVDDCGHILNDESLPYLAKTALSHARAGADIVAPSDMMDFRIAAIRETLDENGFKNTPIMAYSAKYASKFYDPFRVAGGGAPQFGNRKSYQMDYHNSDEALIEVELDLQEGADFIIVKPALSYLDIIRRVKDNFNTPIIAYNVSGEYVLLKNAIANAVASEEMIYEILIAMKRAGADIIITYHAKEMAKMLKECK
ncbi:MAG: porphobilinogen synthase [Tissierellia bacterium]|nr:porphobilinogen synthase [Tissierellia bacterium]